LNGNFDWFGWTIWSLKQLPGGASAIKSTKSRLVREPFAGTHRAMHTTRQVHAATNQILDDRDQSALDLLETLSVTFCTQACEVLANLTGSNAADIHGCIKLIEPTGPGGDSRQDIVRTFVRSSNAGSRAAGDRDLSEIQRVGDCSVWSSIHAVSDGKNEWVGLPCFACPDLLANADRFVSSRSNWKDRYNSTIALPIRYCLDGSGRRKRLLGFLAFDSMRSECLGFLPNAFDYVDNAAGFESRLKRTPVFDAMAVFADSFGMALANLWELTSDHKVVIQRLRLPVIAQDKEPNKGGMNA